MRFAGGRWQPFPLPAPGLQPIPRDVRDCREVGKDLSCTASASYFFQERDPVEDAGFYLLRIRLGN
jgi:hypothetical protein